MANNENDKNLEVTNHPFESLESKREFYEQNIDKYKHAIDEQLNILSTDAKDKAKTGLIIVGAAAVSIWLISKLLSSKSKKKSGSTDYEQDQADINALYIQPPKENKVVEMIKTAIASFLLAIAKEKIANFIDNLNASNDGGTQFSNPTSKETTTGL